MKLMIGMALIAVMMTLWVPDGSWADVHLKRDCRMDAERVPAKDKTAEKTVEELWITREGIRIDAPGKSMIIFSFPRELVLLDHGKKILIRKDLKENPARFQVMAGKDAKKNELMEEIRNSMLNIETVVRDTEEMKNIRGWNCRKYIMTFKTFMGEMEQEVWATQDLKISKKFSDLLMTSMIYDLPGMEYNLRETKSKMREIQGVPVNIISTRKMMRQSHRRICELTEFKEAAAPADLLKIPADYQENQAPDGVTQGLPAGTPKPSDQSPE